MIKALVTLLIIFVAVIGDKLLLNTENYVYKAVIDTITHGLIGLLSWVVVVFTISSQIYSNHWFQIVICGCISSLIDLDHFLAAKSLHLKTALKLNQRPYFHSTTLIIIVFLVLFAFAKVFKSDFFYLLSWIVLVAGGSHHLRDGLRRGLWFPPFGSTPPLQYTIYLGSLALIPHLVATLMGTENVSKRTKYITV